MMQELLTVSLKHARRLIVAVVGFTVLLIGLAMIVLPGPAIVVIPLGLAILATEFVWARRLLQRVKTETERLATKVRGVRSEPHKSESGS
jgi:uncharacterized protein (TIGR02611 family)